MVASRSLDVLLAFGVLLLLAAPDAGRAQPVDIKVIVTFSESPNDVFATPQAGVRVIVGPNEVTTGDDGVARTQVPAGATLVKVPEDVIGDLYRVGFVGIAPTGTGVVRRCAPTTLTGDVTFMASAAEGGPGSLSDYEVGIRGVPVDAEPVENVVNCAGATPTTTTTLPQFCPVPAASGGSRPFAGAAPQVTSFVVPAKGGHREITKISVGFNDADGDVSTIRIEELGRFFWGTAGYVDFAKGQASGVADIGIICTTQRTQTLRAVVSDGQCNSATSEAKSLECVCTKEKELLAWFNPCTKAGLTRLAASLGAQAALCGAAGWKAALVPEPTGVTKAVASAGGGCAAVLGSLAAVSAYLATDPPDPNYTAVAEPLFPSPPSVVASADIPQAITDAVNAAFANLVETIGYARALLTSGERLQGARLAADAFWEVQQQDAVNGYSANLAARLGTHVTRSQAIHDAWMAAGFPEAPISADDLRGFQAALLADDLPFPFSDILTQLGADAATQEQIKTTLLAVDPDAAAGEFPAALVAPELVSTLDDVAGDLDAVASECGSCDDGNACTDDACQPGSGCAHTLRPGVEGIACLANAVLPPACSEALPRAMTAGLAKARALAGKALANAAKARKFLAKARKPLGKAVKAAAKAKRKGKLSAECADAFAASVADLRGRIDGFASSG